MATVHRAALLGWGYGLRPEPRRRLTQGRMRRIIDEITSVPDLPGALKAKDLVQKYGICLSTAYDVLRRARARVRNLHVKHADAATGQGRAA